MAVGQFPTVHDAANTVIQAMQEGVQIGRVELIDELMIKGSRTLLICFSSWWHHGPTVLTPPGRGFPQPST